MSSCFEPADFDNHKGLVVMACNICSLYGKTIRISYILPHADIMGVCETWLDKHHDTSMISYPGYNIVRADRRPHVDKDCGGLLFYVRDDIAITVCEDESIICPNYEVLTLLLEFHTTLYKVIMVYN